MNQRKLLAAFLITVTIISCQTETWYRTPSGLVYRIFPSSSKDSVASFGRTIKVNVMQKAGGKIIQNTYDSLPYYEMIMPYGNPYNPSAVFPGLKKGDSVVVKQRVDSMLKKKIFEKLPPWLNKNDEWITTIKVLDVFTNDSMLQADKQKESEKYIAAVKSEAGKKLDAYINSKHAYAKKTNDGIYVETVNDTSSVKIAQGKWVNVHFKLQTIEGRILNNSRDTGAQKGPFGFTIGSGFFPPLTENALLNKGKGSMVRIYLPAISLFGLNMPKDMKKEEALVFEIEILDVKDKAPDPKKQNK